MGSKPFPNDLQPRVHVSIGDVGYVREGVFIRKVNVILPWDHESDRTLGEPVPYESLDCGPFTKILDVPLKTQEHYSRNVSAKTNDSNAQACALRLEVTHSSYSFN